MVSQNACVTLRTRGSTSNADKVAEGKFALRQIDLFSLNSFVANAIYIRPRSDKFRVVHTADTRMSHAHGEACSTPDVSVTSFLR